MTLPLLILLAFGGDAALQAGKWAFEVQNALSQGLVAEESDGGVTPSVLQTVQANLGADPTLRAAAVSVTGSRPTVPWGGSVWLKVAVAVPTSFPVSLLSGGTLTFAGTLYGTSNAPPP